MSINDGQLDLQLQEFAKVISRKSEINHPERLAEALHSILNGDGRSLDIRLGVATGLTRDELREEGISLSLLRQIFCRSIPCDRRELYIAGVANQLLVNA